MFTYLIIAYMLIFSTMHAMNIQVIKSPHVPLEQNIDDKTTQISFKKQTMSLCLWVDTHRKRTFGKNRIFEFRDTLGLQARGTIRDMRPEDIDYFDTMACAYITNLEKRYVSHNRYVMLGAFLFYNPNHLPSQINKTELLQRHYLNNPTAHIRPPKPLTLQQQPKKITPQRSKKNI